MLQYADENLTVYTSPAFLSLGAGACFKPFICRHPETVAYVSRSHQGTWQELTEYQLQRIENGLAVRFRRYERDAIGNPVVTADRIVSGSHACELYAQDIHSGRNRLYLNESGWTDDGVKLVQRALNRFLWKCGKTSFEEISDDERFVPAAFNSGVRSSCPTPERVEKAQGRGKTSFATKPAKTIPLLRCTLPALEAMLLQAIDSKQNALTDRIFAIMQRKGGKKTG